MKSRYCNSPNCIYDVFHKLLATLLGYKVQSLPYTEVIHFQYYIFCTAVESFYYTKV